MPKQPTSLNSLSRDLFAPCDDGQVLVKDSSQVSGVAPANNGAGGNPFDQDLNTDDLPQFAGLGIGTPGVAKFLTLTAPDDFALSPAVLNTGVLSGQQLAFNVGQFEATNGFVRIGNLTGTTVGVSIDDPLGNITALQLGFGTDGSVGAIGFYTAGTEQWSIGYDGTLFSASAGILATGTVSASGYLVGANPGVTGTVTTASLVGMTMNFENGIYMGLT